MFVNNTIVQECLHNKLYNTNTVIVYGRCNLHLYIMEDMSPVDCLHMLIMAISNEVTVDVFEGEELDFIINSITCQ